MKLQISFELTNLSDALDLAKKTHQYADIIEVGTLLIYKEGVKAVEAFRKEFPDKEEYKRDTCLFYLLEKPLTKFKLVRGYYGIDEEEWKESKRKTN